MKTYTIDTRDTRKKSNNYLWKIVLFIILIMFFVIYNLFSKYTAKIVIDTDVYLKKWTWLESLYANFNDTEKFYFKLYLKFNWEDLKDIKPWYYLFNGSYTKSDIIKVLKAGPTQKYAHITILEWWGKYDVDSMLAEKWYIQFWEYISFIDDKAIISKYAKRYEFIDFMDKALGWDLSTLEWVLYPDTYYIDPDKNIIDQLVYSQLDAFQKKVWVDYKDAVESFNSRLSSYWYNLKLNIYEIFVLASIIDKEERNVDQKFTIAWIFLNRKDLWMRLDADITLCYWLKKSYKACTPNVISSYIKDATNPYNTRTTKLLPPTPICNFGKDSLTALLNFKSTKDLFYLHDSKWLIHTAQTNDQHNMNKANYLR